MYQRFAPLGVLVKLFFYSAFKQSIEILVFITKLSVRSLKLMEIISYFLHYVMHNRSLRNL